MEEDYDEGGIDLEILELEKRSRRRKLRLGIISITVVALFILSISAKVIIDLIVPKISYGDFEQHQSDFYYEDDRFKIVSYDYLDDINLGAINDLYDKYDRILEMMQHEAMGKIELYLYGNRDHYLKTNVSANGAIAYYKDGIIRVLNPNAEGVDDYTEYRATYNDYSYEHILLVHEFIHAVHEDQYGAFSVNSWVNEGLAEYISYDIIGFDRLDIKSQYVDKEIPFDTFKWIASCGTYVVIPLKTTTFFKVMISPFMMAIFLLIGR
jgi:hypothetical protein